ncbi:hypothetical protein GCM10023187_23390 [Nibrella viscosa]|uniref:DUF3244 domain-containing protein n=1 Tax=Nibrella viscosa TaxID=1084524 RepID=A0ABP8KFG1_9BACT
MVALYLPSLTTAQPNTYFSQSAAAEKGYWKLFTDNQSRSTHVRFFDAQNQLVYEEVLAGKYIKLTDQNVDRLNQLLDQVMESRLIAASLKATPLEETIIHNQPVVWSGPSLKPEATAAVKLNNPLNYNIRLNSHLTEYQNKQMLRVQVENPERYRLAVSVRDKNGQAVYWEPVTQSNCLVKLNLSELKHDSYTLEVTTPNRNYSYIRRIEL